MFRREVEMAPVVEAWLAEQHLVVRHQFESAVGVADLVGCQLARERVEARLELGQNATLANALRAAVWLSVPKASSRRSIPRDELVQRFAAFVGGARLEREIDRLLATGLLSLTARGKLRRPAPWYPLHRRMVAIELKLSRWQEALDQAEAYADFAPECYVALPIHVAERVLGAFQSVANCSGLLSVSSEGVEVLLKARKCRPFDKVNESLAAEAFWPAVRRLEAVAH